MRNTWLMTAACMFAVSGAVSVSGQGPSANSKSSKHVCECGAHPPAPPRDREVAPYAGEPRDLSPYGKFAAPYDLNYIRPNIYVGAGRDLPEPKNLTEVRIGFFGPIDHNPDQVFGLRMLHGAQMAVEEANARGGYGGKPFRLMLHNDYDNWQAKQVYGEDRPTDPTIWGSASDEAVKMIYDDEENTILALKKFLSYLPSNNVENPPVVIDDGSISDINEKLRVIVPDDPNKAYDVKDVINQIVDKNSFFETAELFGASLVTGFSRLRGKTLGIVANQPKVLAGVLDIDSSTKGARFIRFCDAFNIPILTLEDVPGFLPGVDQEHAGIIRHGAKLLFAYSEATVPKITVILRKAYGGAFIVMNSKNLGGDFSFAWPSAEIAVMGPDGAVAILYRRELAESENPVELKKELVKRYRDKIANPFIADESGYIDEGIDPAMTRKKIISAFEALNNKWVKVPARKHGNMPL